MNFRFLSEARQEYREVILYYEEQRIGLGQQFAAEFEEYLSKVLESPDSYALINEEIRSINLRRFPYAIHYVLTPDEVFVVAVPHHSRHPGYWRHRTNPE